MCVGIGFGTEPAPLDSGEPLRAEGLTAAIKAAFADGRCSEADVDFRLTDNNGETYGFKESALAVARVFRETKEEFDIWHPADCIGEVGAAILPILVGIMQAAVTRDYAPGPGVLCHVSGTGQQRGAMILRYRKWKDD
jgi:3-oxoacyl-[acyl-carrier-protein] synthase-1